jgi:hypothetical protein
MRLAPFTVGVEASRIFRRRNAAVRLIASESGSPSAPTLAGNLSISSARSNRTGLELRDAGELAPLIVRTAPATPFRKMLLSESRDRGAPIWSRRTSQSRIAGMSRSLLNAAASSRVGMMYMEGPGSFASV